MISFIKPVIAAGNQTIFTSALPSTFILTIVAYGFFILALLVFIFLLLKRILRFNKGIVSSFNKQLLKITLPKYSNVDNEGNAEQKGWQDIVNMTESFFASIGGLKAKGKFINNLQGVQNHVSFEIVSSGGKINFYVAVPTNIENYIIQQIGAHFPDAQIECCDDYNIFKPNSVPLGSYFTLKRHYSFPLKTYRNMSSDVLNDLTNSLAKLSPDEGAAIQILATSAPSSWRMTGKNFVKLIQDGENPSNIQARGVITKSFNFIFSSIFNFNNKKNKNENQHHLSPLQQKMVEAIEEKMSRAGLLVNIRVVVSTANENQSKRYLSDITNVFTQYNIYEYGNALKAIIFKSNSRIVSDFIYRHFNSKMSLLLNTEELSSIYHFPHQYIDTPHIDWLESRQAPPPAQLPSKGLLLGISNYRNEAQEVRLKVSDRRRHVYVIGQTGTGKSTFMKNLFIQDLQNGEGCCVIDPHGDFALDILKNVPQERLNDIIYFNPADTDRPIGINMLEFENSQQKTFVVNELLSIFDKLYDLKATGGPMFEQYMRNALLLIMSDSDSGMTLMEVPRVLADEEFRKLKLSRCDNQTVKDFWIKEAQAAGGEASLANMVPYITSKLTPFIANDVMRPIISQQKSSINFRQIMDEKKILVVNLSKGKLGDINSQLLGMIITGKILMSALSRVDMPEDKRHDFYLYIDEFQNFTTNSIAVILSEARKYRLDLTIAHQYIGQLVKDGNTNIRDAVFGNVGTTVSFRIGVDDAEIIAKQMSPVFNEYDVTNVPKFTAYLKLLIDNANPPAFSININPPIEGSQEVADAAIEYSRNKYGRPREVIEEEIRQRQLFNI